MYLTDKQIDSGNSHILPFIVCVVYTVDECPALSEVNQVPDCMWFQLADKRSSINVTKKNINSGL